MSEGDGIDEGNGLGAMARAVAPKLFINRCCQMSRIEIQSQEIARVHWKRTYVVV